MTYLIIAFLAGFALGYIPMRLALGHARSIVMRLHTDLVRLHEDYLEGRT